MLSIALLLASLLPASTSGSMVHAPAAGGERLTAGFGSAESGSACGKKRNRRPRLPRNRSGLPFEEDEDRADVPKVSGAGNVVSAPSAAREFTHHAGPAHRDTVTGKRYLILHILLI